MGLAAWRVAAVGIAGCPRQPLGARTSPLGARTSPLGGRASRRAHQTGSAVRAPG
jgi:hypothetical protein